MEALNRITAAEQHISEPGKRACGLLQEGLSSILSDLSKQANNLKDLNRNFQDTLLEILADHHRTINQNFKPIKSHLESLSIRYCSLLNALHDQATSRIDWIITSTGKSRDEHQKNESSGPASAKGQEIMQEIRAAENQSNKMLFKDEVREVIKGISGEFKTALISLLHQQRGQWEVQFTKMLCNPEDQESPYYPDQQNTALGAALDLLQETFEEMRLATERINKAATENWLLLIP